MRTKSAMDWRRITEIAGHLAADFFDDLDEESLPVLGGAAPFVGAVVGVRAQELIDEIALTAHDLDGVVAGASGILGSLSKEWMTCRMIGSVIRMC